MQKLLISILALFMSTICAQADKKSIVLLQRIHNYAATIDTTNHASEVSYTYTRTTFNVERRNFLLMLVPTVYAISHGKQRQYANFTPYNYYSSSQTIHDKP